LNLMKLALDLHKYPTTLGVLYEASVNYAWDLHDRSEPINNSKVNKFKPF